jgi:NhaP-type Na+/H+ or K+/H+ antiporter
VIAIVLAAAAAALARSLFAAKLQRWYLGAPLVMVLAGVLVGLTVKDSVAAALNTEVAQHVAEIVLAYLLFLDATEVRGGRLWGSAPTLVARVLLVAMPLSLALTMLLGSWLFSELPWAVLLIIACVVVPTDFAPSEHIVRDKRVPRRVRNVLNIESGYNDGIISPVFVFAMLVAGNGVGGAPTVPHALWEALVQAAKAIVVGILVGAAVAALLHRSELAGWTGDQSRRLTVVLTPLVAYTAALGIHGNGFVASFACGIAFRYWHRALTARRIRRDPAARRAREPFALARDFGLIEDVTALMTMTVWFVIGLVAVILWSDGTGWRPIVFCLAALTVVRVAPVLLSLLGTAAPARDRLLIALFGPRGTTTIVFGLIAFNGLKEDHPANVVLLTAVLCVLGSVLLHGPGSEAVLRRGAGEA